MIEKLMFKKVELWAVLLLLLFAVLGALFFGWLIWTNLKGSQQFPKLSAIAVKIVSMPSKVHGLWSGELKLDDHQAGDRFEQAGGFTFFKDVQNPNYVLLSRYDGDIRRSVVELVEESKDKPVHAWVFDNDAELTFESDNPFLERVSDSEPSTMRVMHPWLDADGSIIVNFQSSPLYKLDACANLVWMNTDFAFHHSIEKDADGNFWSPGRTTTDIDPRRYDDRFMDDHLVQVSPEGKTLFRKSVINILREHGLDNRMYDYDQYQTNPIHLNDIQPLIDDGEHWNSGDVFFSIAHLNMVVLYRPSDDKIIWWTQGEMMHQHDVDILSDGSITIFDNRRTTSSRGKPLVIDNNHLIQIKIPDGRMLSDWRSVFAEHDIKTPSQGLSDFIEPGGLMVEETDYGRLLKFDEAMNLEWVYINKNKSNGLFTMNWSRYITKEYGDKLSAKLVESNCDGS